MHRTHIIHHNDLDGYCCAAIVCKWLEGLPTRGDFKVTEHVFGYNKGLNLDVIEFDDSAYLLDCTPSPEEFEALMKKLGVENVVWVDHHQTNIDKVKHLPQPQSKLSDTHPAACMLTWQLLYDDAPAPNWVEWVSKWDTFTHDYIPTILDFVWGAKTAGLETSIEAWRSLMTDKTDTVIREIVNVGGAVRRFDGEQMLARLDNHGFDVRVPTRSGAFLKGKALNIGKVNSFAFESCEDQGYDVFVPFYWDGKQWTVSLYAPRDRQGATHLGEHCSAMGGGGHENAAGYQCKQLPEWLDLG